MIYILYNPLANNGRGYAALSGISDFLPDLDKKFLDITKINPIALFEMAAPEDKFVISGGDGTINCFINQCEGYNITHTLYYYPSGSGNDFFRDISDKNNTELIPLNDYIQNLPIITVNGTKKRFINGIGYGLDGYACEEGDRLRALSNKKINYSAIAFKGLLYKFKPVRATISVDGCKSYFNNVWMAPTLNGRYFGGGVMIAPDQNRKNAQRFLTALVVHSKSRLRLLSIFPSIYSGQHKKYTDIVKFFTGHKISVSFNKPIALQIDGETIKNVTSYTVNAV